MTDIPIIGRATPPGEAELEELRAIGERGDINALVALNQRCDVWLSQFMDAMVKAGQTPGMVALKTSITVLLEMQRCHTAINLSRKAAQEQQQAYAWGLEDGRDLQSGAKTEVHREGFPHVKYGQFDDPEQALQAEQELRAAGAGNVTIIPDATKKPTVQ